MHGKRLVVTLSCLVVFVAAPRARAEVEEIPLGQMVSRSAWIAVVDIISVRAQPPQSRYRMVATVVVRTAIKGVKSGETITLEYDTGDICPNVLYSQGERCLIFASRTANHGYDTLGDYWGKARIAGDVVQGLYPELCGDLKTVHQRINAISKSDKP